MSDSSQPHRLEPTRLLCPWNFLGKNTGVDFLLQEIFPTQGSNPHLLHLLHWQVDSLLLAPPRKNFSIICNILTFFHSFHSSNLSVDYYEFSTFTRMSIVCVCVLVSRLYPTLCNSVDCSLPGSSVCGILQARILECFAMASPGDLPNPGIKPRSPTLQVDSLPFELCEKPPIIYKDTFFLLSLFPWWVTSVVSNPLQPHGQ